MIKTDEPRIYYIHGKHVVHVAAHRGEELFLLLASQGIESQVLRTNGRARLELDGDINLSEVRAILHHWQD